MPFAFSTGYGGHGVDEGYGIHPVLDKPFDGAQLEQVLNALLTAGKQRRHSSLAVRKFGYPSRPALRSREDQGFTNL